MYKYSTWFLLKTYKTRNEPCARENMWFVLYNCFPVRRTWNRSKVTMVGKTCTAIFISFFGSPWTAVGRELGLASGDRCVRARTRKGGNEREKNGTYRNTRDSVVGFYCCLILSSAHCSARHTTASLLAPFPSVSCPDGWVSRGDGYGVQARRHAPTDFWSCSPPPSRSTALAFDGLRWKSNTRPRT